MPEEVKTGGESEQRELTSWFSYVANKNAANKMDLDRKLKVLKGKALQWRLCY